jgi:hypothetical protein
MKRMQLKIAAATLAMAMPMAANAESNFRNGAGVLNASARVDFTIVIPRILFLQVGTGTLLADNIAIDLITFDVPAASVGSGTPVAATVGSGDIGNGTVTARLIANDGDVSLNVITPGAMTNGSGPSISYGQITTTVAALGGVAGLLTAPILADGVGTPVPFAAVNGVVNRGAQWTYAYLNAAPAAAGTYGGAGNVQNGRATYTVALP